MKEGRKEGRTIPQVEVKNKISLGHPKSDGMIRVTNAVEQVRWL